MDKGEGLRNQDSHLTLSDGSDKPEFHYSLVSRHNLMLEVVHILLRHIQGDWLWFHPEEKEPDFNKFLL
jgi:hypothetical protein